MAGAEPFPLLSTSADQLHMSSIENGSARRRRKSSGLGQEIRVGDTGAPSLGTGLLHSPLSLAPSSATSSISPTSLLNGYSRQPGSGSSFSMSGAGSGEKRLSKRRKARSVLRRGKHFAVRHTWTLPLILLVVFLSLYAISPTESNPIHHFIFLSYRLPLAADADPANTLVQYGKGRWDIALVFFYTIVLSFTREFMMQEVLRPLARFYGIKSRGKQARFMEQSYTALYFGVLGPAGMYVMSRTPVWYFSTPGMYEGFPHKTHDACFKFYYLFQAAYWAQQAIVLVLGMEKPRKDFKELVAHHVVSLTLIALSYRFHFTRMGLAVYITHDISDFFLASSKSLHYIDSPIVEPYYFFFIGTWVYLRHFVNLRILYSISTEFVTVGPFELDWEAEQYKSRLAQVIAAGLLGSLQALNLFWLFYILRIAYRFIRYNHAEDDRSDAEESDNGEPLLDEKSRTNTDWNEKTPLLADRDNGNGFANGGASKTRPNGFTQAPSSRS